MRNSGFVRMEYRQIWMLFEDFGHHGGRLFPLVVDSGMALQGIGNFGPHFRIIKRQNLCAPVRRTFSPNVGTAKGPS